MPYIVVIDTQNIHTSYRIVIIGEGLDLPA